MSRILQNLELGLDEDLAEKLAWLEPGYSGYHVLRQSLDARRKREAPKFVYTVEVFSAGESPRLEHPTVDRVKWSDDPVVIVGSGPAGLFAALRLVERGVPCVLLEQGAECGPRVQAIARYWRYGELNPRSNVGFGEGGAGLFSDGKLITRIRSPHIPYVMDRLVQFGAPEEIRYLANPHVGSDRIRRIIPVLRQFLLQNGAQVFFNAKVSRLLVSGKSMTGVQLDDGRIFSSPRVILACGHSAEDIFAHLQEIGVYVEGKSFAVGLRIEHPQAEINRIQYRDYAEHPKVGAANYKLAATDKSSGVGVYSFCMCPGGYVLASSTAPGEMVVNGMSNYRRSSPYANAAIVVSVDYQKHFGADLNAGLKWRRSLESRAYDMVLKAGGQKEVPAQKLSDYLAGRAGSVLPSSSPSHVVPARLDQLLEPAQRQQLISSLHQFDRWMKGFISEQAQLHGVESRTSCPWRITRHPDTYQSLSHVGLYPAGEGAGYAGGITSAACDGVTIADAIATEHASQKQVLVRPG